VLAWKDTEDGRWDVDAFYAEGERDISSLLAEAAALGVTPVYGDALDFGCGVGRLSNALADRFEHVTGVDISAPMVDQARRLVEAKKDNCDFVVNVEPTLPFASASFNFLVSNIVLQHIPPRLAKGYVREFMRILKSGGVAIFQQPAECTWQSEKPVIGAIINLFSPHLRERIYRSRRARDPKNFPMYTIPRNEMLTFVERNGGQVVACVEDRWAGPNWRSFHYIVRAHD
jgi:SAM-dependent methyltransferase